MTDDKIRENRLRRMAARQRLTLTRSRRRDRRAADYGLYWLTNPAGERVTDSGGVTIDEIEQHLTEDH
ncbi:hypothetical protein [Streptomyces lavendulae]|uniref:hypothetical protein n=1 Tax=Streptomyces lavendulae TaxID=1914 RepID=UPI0031E8AEFA